MGFQAESAASIRLGTPPPASRLEQPSASALECAEPGPSRTVGPRPAWSRPGASHGNRSPLQWSGSTGPHSTGVRPPVVRTLSGSAPKHQTPEPTAQSHSDCADAGARIPWKASPIITTSPLLREPWGSAYAYNAIAYQTARPAIPISDVIPQCYTPLQTPHHSSARRLLWTGLSSTRCWLANIRTR